MERQSRDPPREEHGLFETTSPTARTLVRPDETYGRQGYLEQSNVELVTETLALQAVDKHLRALAQLAAD